MFLSDQGYLLRKAPSGERNLLLVLFLYESGLKYTLLRRSTKSTAGPPEPDLFDRGTFLLQQGDASRPAFLKEFSPTEHHAGIGRSYRALKSASDLGRFYERNLLHMEHFAVAWSLLEKALPAIAAGDLPEAVLLKTCFVLARSEGYPVIAHWLNQKTGDDYASLCAFLQSPIQDCRESRETVEGWIRDLSRFFVRETDLLPAVD